MNRIRGSVPQPMEGYPALGAFHEIMPNASVDRFMRGFCAISDEVFSRSGGSQEIDGAPHIASDFEPIEVIPPEQEEYNFRKFYRAYYGTSMWVSVLDMGHSEKMARAMRSVWEKQDLGATEQIARDEISRQMPDIDPCLQLDQVVRLGRRLPGALAGNKGRKLALVPNAGECTATQDLLHAEHDIIIEAIKKRLKNFVEVGAYIPHMTFA